MDAYTIASYFLMTWTDPYLIFLTAVGTFAGIYVGAVPGLSVTMAVSILISFTFSWELNDALAVMAGVFIGGVYGGARTAVMINVPGSPAAVAATFDGYPMSKLGLAGRAIGLCTTASFIGAVFGIVVLAVVAPVVSEFALLFAPRDYLLLALLGILLIGSQSGESLAKGVLAGAFGIMVGSIGLDPMTAEPRLTFGTTNMMGGIHFVAAMIGFFGISETMVRLFDFDKKVGVPSIDRILPSWRELLRHLPLAARSGMIGVLIGALPGAGGEIAATTAYGDAVRSVKQPTRPFGTGASEGIIAPQVACNAAIGSAYIPMLTLGIPGDAVTAVLIAALQIHGLRPGPMLMIETPHLFWFTVGNLLLATVFMLGFGLTGIRAFARAVQRPPALLIPVIVILAVVGTYSIQNSISDVFWMLGLGIVGYFLKRYGYQIGPVVIGCILGPIIDMNLRRTIISARESPLTLAADIVGHPISLILAVAVVSLLVMQTPPWQRFVARRRERKPT